MILLGALAVPLFPPWVAGRRPSRGTNELRSFRPPGPVRGGSRRYGHCQGKAWARQDTGLAGRAVNRLGNSPGPVL